MKIACIAVVSAVASLAFVGCKSSHEEGVTSTFRSQYTTVAADVGATTDAAKAVLESHDYKSVAGDSDKDVGKAMAKMADGTDVKVAVAKHGTGGSDVTVTVGMAGSPTLGAKLASEIKMKAEGMNMDSMKTMP